MSVRLRYALFAAGAAAALGVLLNELRLLTPAAPPDSLPVALPELENGWFLLTSNVTNAFTAWRLDPYLSFAGTQYYVPLAITIYFSGALTAYLGLQREPALLPAGLLAALATAAPLYLFGRDTVVWGVLAWLPWYFLWLVRLCRCPTLADSIVLLFLGLRLAKSGNQLSLIALLLCALAVPAFVPGRWKIGAWWSFLVSALPAVVIGFSAPAPRMPQYPPFSRVLEMRSSVPGLHPFVGPVPPLQIIDWEFVRTALAPWALTALCAGLAALLLFRTLPQKKVLAAGLLAGAMALVIDTGLLSAELLELGPVQTMMRVLPGVCFFPLLTVVFALWLFFFAALFVDEAPWLALAPAVAAAVWLAGPPVPVFAARFDDGALLQEAPHVYFSPSHQLTAAKYVNLHSTDAGQLKFVPLASIPHTLAASHHPETLGRLADHDREQRWTSGGGQQRGDEWLQIRFAAPQSLQALVLSPGPYHSDFPRGVEIGNAGECGGQDVNLSSFMPIVRIPSWDGPLRRTREGLPYIGAQSDVTVVFPEPVTTRCLLVKQIGRGSHFDWSVTEIDVGLPR